MRALIAILSRSNTQGPVNVIIVIVAHPPREPVLLLRRTPPSFAV